MPYTMFASAVFFAPERHEDCEYRLDPIHIYRCQNGFWECMRVHGSRQKSSKLGEMMRACDQRLRLALDPAHPLKEEKVPKYLAKIIDDEVVAWLSWDAAHQPVKIDKVAAADKTYRVEKLPPGGVAHDDFAPVSRLVTQIGGKILCARRGAIIEIEGIELCPHKLIKHPCGKNAPLSSPFTNQCRAPRFETTQR